MDAATKLYPAWRQVESDLLAGGLAHGSIITDELLKDGFGIKPTTNIAEHEKNQLVFLRQITALRESLLHSHKMMLVSEPGVGYRVAMPGEQTKLALHNRSREMRCAMAKMMAEVTHVDHEKLTDAERKENADAHAKMGALRSIVRKELMALR